MENITTSQALAGEVAAYFRARNPLLWVKTREVSRVKRYLIGAANAAGMILRTWDCAQGVCDQNGTRVNVGSTELGETLSAVRTASLGEGGKGPCVWVLVNSTTWFTGPMWAKELQTLVNLAESLPARPVDCQQTIVILTSSSAVPDDLTDVATVIDWPLPDRAEVAEALDATLFGLKPEVRDRAAPNGTRNSAVDAAIGLTENEAMACFAKSLVQKQRVDVQAIGNEKKRVIEREKVLQWFDPVPGGLDSVGGLETLKGWLKSRSCAYTPEAAADGLPLPKGVFLLGVPGCGKTLIARAFASERKIPLLKLDLGSLKGPLMGESEQKLRKALNVADLCGDCVILMDEIEKQVSGAVNGGADGGVAADALGTVLQWMNDRKSRAFIFATANKIENVPPELVRAGRFDERFFVDLPNWTERKQVLLAAFREAEKRILITERLERFKRACLSIDQNKIATDTQGFAGAEIAALVPNAMFAAHNDGRRPLVTDDLLIAAKAIVPLSKGMPAQIENLRSWVKDGRAIAASAPESTIESPSTQRRVLNIG